MLFIRLLKESITFAWHAIIVNKLRTLLSLLGITIGIFAIISVLTVVDSFERNIKDNISTLGEDIIRIEKWPWEFGPDYKWWVYMRRPVPTIKEYGHLKKKSKKAGAFSFLVFTSRTIKKGNNYIENASILGVTHDFQDVRHFEIEDGRYFSVFESEKGHNVCIIGSEITGKLFENQNPIGEEIKMAGRNFKIIGVFKKEGKNIFGESADNIMMIPVNYARNFVDIRNDRLNPSIMVKPKANISIEELKDELTSLLRAYRRIKPKATDNFALNQASFITQGFKPLFRILDIAGWIIGGFSILVGGFGIANIMFVSVKERTNIIGIQKSLGAKNYFILFQFLFESVFLALIGGILGLIIIFAGTVIASNTMDMTIVLSMKNISLGVFISIIIGIISGFLPALTASRLDPVEAINTTF